MSKYYELGNAGVIETDTPEFWDADPNAKPLPAAEGKRRLKEEARANLLETLKPGDTVYTVLRHVSRTGMRRRIDLYVFRPDHNNECAPQYLTQWAAWLMGETVHKDGGIIIGGCGMDMGWELVYRLGYALWPKGTETPHGTRNGEPDSAGGYALRHRWL